jgi:hypothetical protein
MAIVILVRVALGLIRGEDVSRWARQLEAILREMEPKEPRP